MVSLSFSPLVVPRCPSFNMSPPLHFPSTLERNGFHGWKEAVIDITRIQSRCSDMVGSQILKRSHLMPHYSVENGKNSLMSTIESKLGFPKTELTPQLALHAKLRPGSGLKERLGFRCKGVHADVLSEGEKEIKGSLDGGDLTKGGLIPAPKGEPPEYKMTQFDEILLNLFREKMVQEVGWDSEKIGYAGLIEVAHKSMTKNKTRDQKEEASVRILRALFPPLLLPLFRLLIAPLGDRKPAAILTAYVTQVTCQWLMGPCKVTEVELPDGSKMMSGVTVERCKYLEESKCASVCIHTCKQPTQTFIREDMGIPLAMEPNFTDFSCQFKFGVEAPPREKDEALMSACLEICPVGKTKPYRLQMESCPQVSRAGREILTTLLIGSFVGLNLLLAPNVLAETMGGESFGEYAGEVLFGIGQRANDIVQSNLSSGLTITSGGVVFLAGLATSLSPCTLSVLPLTIGYIGGYDAGKTRVQVTLSSLSFCLGLASTLSLLGLSASLAGRLYGQYGPLSSFLPLLVGGVAILMGLNLLGVVPLQLPSFFANFDPRKSAASLPPAVQTYLAGLTFALAASPCSTPVLTSLLAYVAATEDPVTGGALLLAYTSGYVAPLIVAASFAGSLKRILSFRQYSKWVNPTSGALLLGGGIYSLLTRLFPDPNMMNMSM